MYKSFVHFSSTRSNEDESCIRDESANLNKSFVHFSSTRSNEDESCIRVESPNLDKSFVHFSSAWSNDNETPRKNTRVVQQTCETVINSHRNLRMFEVTGVLES